MIKTQKKNHFIYRNLKSIYIIVLIEKPTKEYHMPELNNASIHHETINTFSKALRILDINTVNDMKDELSQLKKFFMRVEFFHSHKKFNNPLHHTYHFYFQHIFYTYHHTVLNRYNLFYNYLCQCELHRQMSYTIV